MEWAAIVLVGLLGLAACVRGAGRLGGLVAGVALAALVGGWWLRATAAAPAGSPADPASARRPLEQSDRGYVSSDTCQSCHPAQYESWRRSYHRTMTQVVTPETMLADWDGTTLDIRHRYRLEREGDYYYVDMVDPEFDPSRRLRGKLVASDNGTRRVPRRVVQATGSHHQQVFWYASGNGRELHLLPFTWLVPQQRWVPYDFTLLRPMPRKQVTEEWNRICIACHATAGRPRPVSGSNDLDTHVAELGIACESCHGPAEEHVEHNRNPLRRYASHLGGAGGAGVVNPAELSSLRSAQVCGQCHSQHTFNGRVEAKRALQLGSSYRPGEDLEKSKFLYRRPADPGPVGTFDRFEADSITWPDGMVRTTGRDYHGLLASPCFAGGDFTCLSCHSMHGYADPVDQLAPGMDGNRACLQCHGGFETATAVEAHTRHPAGSSGSLCYGCHMPHTTYGLLKGVRSHTLSSPNVAESARHGRPNACNLCHLDQTLAWAGEHLRAWYDQRPDLPEGFTFSKRSAAVDWLLEGDAAQRALIASAMSRPDAQAASGVAWMPPLLLRLIDDPYPAVRLIVEHTLATLPGFDELPRDRIRAVARSRSLADWKSPAGSGPGGRVYQQSSGRLDVAGIDAAISCRDDRVVNIAE